MDIKEIRKILRLTQKDFAKRYDIPLGTVKNWEQKISTPPKYVLNLIEETIYLPDKRDLNLVYNDLSYEMFKSEIEHIIKFNNEKIFMEKMLRLNAIETLWNKKAYKKALYIMALLEYLYDKNEMNFPEQYEIYKQYKLEKIVLPQEVLLIDKLNRNNNEAKKIINKCKASKKGKYFLKYNIIEL